MILGVPLTFSLLKSLSFLSHAGAGLATAVSPAIHTVRQMTVLKNNDGHARLVALEDVLAFKDETERASSFCRHDGHRGKAALARVTRVTATQLRRYEDRGDLCALIPVDIAVELDLLAGHPFITSKMAELTGHRLYKPADGSGAGEVLSMLMLQKTNKETSEMMEAIIDLMVGANPDLDALRAALKEVLDVQQHTHTLEALIRKQIENKQQEEENA